MSKKLSIVIPCYNEEGSIKKLADKCTALTSEEVEVILVDNGSKDGTYSELKKVADNTSIRVVKVEVNTGYGNGILQGLYECKGEIVGWTHADLQTEPSDIIKAYHLHQKELIGKKCMVKGRRKNRNTFDSFFTFGMSIISSLSLGVRLEDVNAQPKIFHSDFLSEFKNPPLDFSLDLYILYFFRKSKVKIISFPVYFKKRLYGEAKGGGTLKGKVKLIKRTFRYIIKLRKSLKSN